MAIASDNPVGLIGAAMSVDDCGDECLNGEILRPEEKQDGRSSTRVSAIYKEDKAFHDMPIAHHKGICDF